MTIQASESKILCPIIKVFIRADGVEEWSIRSVFNLEVSKCDTTVPLETKLVMILLDSLKFFKYIFSSKLLMLILKKYHLLLCCTSCRESNGWEPWEQGPATIWAAILFGFTLRRERYVLCDFAQVFTAIKTLNKS